MTCRILVLEHFEQVLAGSFELTGDVISVHPEAGYAQMLARMLAHAHITDKGRAQVTSKDDPVRWFESLPENYCGTYLRAYMDDGAKKLAK
jgi:hypothetical protein